MSCMKEEKAVDSVMGECSPESCDKMTACCLRKTAVAAKTDLRQAIDSTVAGVLQFLKKQAEGGATSALLLMSHVPEQIVDSIFSDLEKVYGFTFKTVADLGQTPRVQSLVPETVEVDGKEMVVRDENNIPVSKKDENGEVILAEGFVDVKVIACW